MRVLFLASYPVTAAATRFRIAQFFPYLRRMGVECTLWPFLSQSLFAGLYRREDIARKAIGLAMRSLRRLGETILSRRFDVVVVQRSAVLFGPPLLEWIIARVLRRPIVYDYDDAIWLPDASPVWGRWATWLKYPAKTASLIRIATHIVACNGFTRDYALRFREPRDVTVIPTVVDADEFCPVSRERIGGLVVGWIGTHSTARYLDIVREPLAAAAKRFDFSLKIVGASHPFVVPGVTVENKAWRLEDEVRDYQSLDIGLYPVADDEWGRGKTGFKPVVYMSCGVASVCSPVGGVTEFARHGENVLFASTTEEWVESLCTLLSDRSLRQQIGAAGRRTVLEHYSMQSQAPRLLEVLERSARNRD